MVIDLVKVELERMETRGGSRLVLELEFIKLVINWICEVRRLEELL